MRLHLAPVGARAACGRTDGARTESLDAVTCHKCRATVRYRVLVLMESDPRLSRNEAYRLVTGYR